MRAKVHIWNRKNRNIEEIIQIDRDTFNKIKETSTKSAIKNVLINNNHLNNYKDSIFLKVENAC